MLTVHTSLKVEKVSHTVPEKLQWWFLSCSTICRLGLRSDSSVSDISGCCWRGRRSLKKSETYRTCGAFHAQLLKNAFWIEYMVIEKSYQVETYIENGDECSLQKTHEYVAPVVFVIRHPCVSDVNRKCNQKELNCGSEKTCPFECHACLHI